MAQLNDLLSNIYNIKNDMKQAIINKGQTVTNFASYPNAILNITSGSSEGDILLFSNLNEMNNYTNANVGDLALVYGMNTNNLQALWQYDNGWNLAPTGLTANKEYVNSAIFWGSNGVEQGILQETNNLTTEQVKIKTQIYSDLSYLELNSNVTNISYIFANRTDLIEIPNINLMNVTNMENTFYNCVNLNDRACNIITNILPNASQLTNQYISNIGLDINRFTNEQINILNVKGYIDAIVPEPTIQNYYEISYQLSNGFNANINLNKGADNDIEGRVLNSYIHNNLLNATSITIKDLGASTLNNADYLFTNLSNVHSIDISQMNLDITKMMTSVFHNCISLNSILLPNLPNVLDMHYLCYGCINLVSAPQINAPNCTALEAAFNGCTNLENVPTYDTHKMMDLYFTFGYCNNLSDSSIQNIVNMCLNVPTEKDEPDYSNYVVPYPSSFMNMNPSYWSSPFSHTNITKDKYLNRWAELEAIGWTY